MNDEQGRAALVERAASAIWDYRRRDTGWEPWEELRDTRPDGSSVESKSHYRSMARAALQAAAPSHGDDLGSDWLGLDELLDSLHPQAAITRMERDSRHKWHITIQWVTVPGVSPVLHTFIGTGPTRMEAIRNAVANAKGEGAE